jgi:hypothetical protein
MLLLIESASFNSVGTAATAFQFLVAETSRTKLLRQNRVYLATATFSELL